MTTWTAEQDQVIIEGRGKLNHEQIANRINHLFGWTTTRSAISGRVDRLGLPNVRMPGRPKGPRINGEHKARKAPTVIASPPIPVEPLNILFIDLEPFHCREIVGKDGFQSLSCGHEKYRYIDRLGDLATSSYCRWHHEINHTAPVSRALPYHWGAR